MENSPRAPAQLEAENEVTVLLAGPEAPGATILTEELPHSHDVQFEVVDEAVPVERVHAEDGERAA